MYLYVEKTAGLKSVPEALLHRFGLPQSVMTMLLKPGQRLASTSADKVLAAIEQQGFYLQLPPSADAEMQAMASQNSKLSAGPS